MIYERNNFFNSFLVKTIDAGNYIKKMKKISLIWDNVNKKTNYILKGLIKVIAMKAKKCVKKLQFSLSKKYLCIA